MQDKKMLKLLNEFANDHVLATEIEVDIGHYSKSFKPRPGYSGCRYEDANLLASIICGAENLCWFMLRNGYKVVRSHKK